MKIENIKYGQILYYIACRKLGNTAMLTTFICCVEVISIAEDFSSVVVSRNENRPRTVSRKALEKYRKEASELREEVRKQNEN